MHKQFRLLTVAGSMALILLASGCGKSRHDAGEKYFLVATNIKLPYWQAAAEGLARASTNLSVQTELVGPDTYDPQAQLEIFQRTVAKKPSGIMISAADPEMMKPEIDKAIAAGIPVVTMDSDSPNSRRLFFIGTDNYQAGVTGGKILVKQLNGKGNVVVFTIPAQANLIERLRGYQEAIANTDIKIVQTVDVRGDPSIAFDRTMEIIEKGKLNVDAFVCLEATAGKEVADVLARRKVQGKTIVAMDTDDGTLDWIEKGGIVATVAQKPFTMAYYGIRALDDLHHTKPEKLDANWRQDLQALVPAAIDTGSSLIDRTSVSSARKK